MGGRGASERYASIPYHVLFGRAPLTSFLTMASSTGEDWKVDALDEEASQRKVANVMEAQQELHKVAKERGKKNHKSNSRLLAKGTNRTLRWEIM